MKIKIFFWDTKTQRTWRQDSLYAQINTHTSIFTFLRHYNYIRNLRNQYTTPQGATHIHSCSYFFVIVLIPLLNYFLKKESTKKSMYVSVFICGLFCQVFVFLFFLLLLLYKKKITKATSLSKCIPQKEDVQL